MNLVAIDSVSTRDADDAFGIEAIEGGYLLSVAISDPTGAVEVGSECDVRAMQQAATVYRRDAVVAKMLPSAISEKRCSLICGEERDAMVVQLKLNSDLDVIETQVRFEKVTVTHSVTHAQVSEVLAQVGHELQPMFQLAGSVAQKRLKQRRGSGALALYDLYRLIATDEEGRIQLFGSKEEVIGYIIVQEFMVMTNVALAKYLLEHNVPAIYRNHVPRHAAPSSKEMADAIQGWIEQSQEGAIDTARGLLSQVGAASYEASVKGHYGLAVTAYTHMTSPLRRYVDLVNIRQFKASVQGLALPYEQQELADIASSVNVTLIERDKARSEHYKTRVKEEALQLLGVGRLTDAKEEVLVQAIKLAAEGEGVHEVLETELLRLLKAGIVSDKVVGTLLLKLPVSKWTPKLRQEYMAWLQAEPSRAMKGVNHAAQTKLATFEVDSRVVAAGYEGRCTLTKGKGSWRGVWAAVRKRDAEHGAVIAAISGMLGVPLDAAQAPDALAPAEVGAAQAQEEPSQVNIKGELLGLCQRNRLPMPSFKLDRSGPSHDPVFSCCVTVGEISATSSAGSKKKAEAQACAAILALLPDAAKTAASETSVKPATSTVSTNFKGELLELCVKQRCSPPVFTGVVTGPSHQPVFKVTVTLVSGGNSLVAAGIGGTKKAAEADASRNMLKVLRKGA